MFKLIVSSHSVSVNSMVDKEIKQLEAELLMRLNTLTHLVLNIDLGIQAS